MKKYLLALVLLLGVAIAVPKASASVIAPAGSPFKSEGYATGGSYMSYSTSIDFGTNPPVGTTFLLSIGILPRTTFVTSVSVGGVTWTKVGQSNVNRDVEFWVGTNSTGVGSNITMNFNHNDGTVIFNVVRELGVNTTNPVDAIAASSGVAANIVSPTLVTHTAGDLIVAQERNMTDGANSFHATNSFHDMGTSGIGIYSTAYLFAGAPGPYSTSWLTPNVVPYDSMLIALRPQ